MPPSNTPPIDNNSYNSNNVNQDGYSERIDLQQLIPLNDTECKHERYVEDPSDETEEYIAMVCSNPKCPVGYLLAKDNVSNKKMRRNTK